MTRPIVRAVSVLTATAAAALLATPALAAPPTRIVDKTAEILCETQAGSTEVVVGVSRSDLEGTAARAEVTVDGELVGEGYTTSDWTASTFRATIPLATRDGDPAGEVAFAGSFRAASAPVTTESKFKAGNVHVVERHTETVLALANLTLVYNGDRLTPSRCDGWQTEGYLSYTNPKMRVERGSSLPYDCTASNGSVPFIFSEGGVDELFVDVPLTTDSEVAASGIVTAADGPWRGSLRVFDQDGEAGTVAASATLTRQRKTHSKGEEGEHFKVTPYSFVLRIAGGSLWAPVTVQCTLSDTAIKLHYPNPEA